MACLIRPGAGLPPGAGIMPHAGCIYQCRSSRAADDKCHGPAERPGTSEAIDSAGLLP